MEFSGYQTMNPGCLFDEEDSNYEDLEGSDYPVNPFEYIPDLPGFPVNEDD